MMGTIWNEFTLTFSEEHEDGLFCGLEFTLDKIETMSIKHVIFCGNGSVNNASPEKMYIRYTFNPRKISYHFDRVRYYSNGTIRHLHPLELDHTNSPEDIRNVDNWNRILKMITYSPQGIDCLIP